MPPLADTVMVVRELIGRPGTSRQLERRMSTPEGLSDEIVRIGDHVSVSGVLESVVDGILLRGTVRAPARVACVRCLAERDDDVAVAVVELFARQTSGNEAEDHGADADIVDDGYEITDDTIDLQTLLRDALAAARPSHPLCRPECAGLCATCGADRNVAPCDGHPEQSDPRWSALAGLDLPNPEIRK